LRALPREKLIELIGKRLAIILIEGWRTARHNAAAAQFIEEVS
jgi:ubiquinone biosynthesis protein UbiJ